MLQFGAQPSDSLPDSIVSFAHPVLVDSDLLKLNPDIIVVDSESTGREIEAIIPDSTEALSFHYGPDSDSMA